MRTGAAVVSSNGRPPVPRQMADTVLLVEDNPQPSIC